MDGQEVRLHSPSLSVGAHACARFFQRLTGVKTKDSPAAVHPETEVPSE